MSELIVTADEGSVRIIRMNRPEKKNALTSVMYDALTASLESAQAASSGIRCVIITGSPNAFCAGNDLQDFQRIASGGAGLSQSIIRFLHALARFELPLVAAVEGLAIGIGTTMLMHCDHVVAADNARFSTPFTHLGLVPEAASSLLAPRLMGYQRAFALLVMGRPIDAAEAKACGLVNTIAAKGEVEAEAMKAAREIAATPPEAIAASRRLLRGSADEIIARIDKEADAYKIRLQSDEARIAFEAFFARKK